MFEIAQNTVGNWIAWSQKEGLDVYALIWINCLSIVCYNLRILKVRPAFCTGLHFKFLLIIFSYNDNSTVFIHSFYFLEPHAIAPETLVFLPSHFLSCSCFWFFNTRRPITALFFKSLAFQGNVDVENKRNYHIHNECFKTLSNYVKKVSEYQNLMK